MRGSAANGTSLLLPLASTGCFAAAVVCKNAANERLTAPAAFTHVYII